jgi:hypothetical protein
MRCLVFVKFLPGGSIPPDEFFLRINAQWSHLEHTEDTESENTLEKTTRTQSPKSAICIADYDSIEQLTTDLTIMPGAGISNVEVVPISEEMELEYLSTDIPSMRSGGQ